MLQDQLGQRVVERELRERVFVGGGLARGRLLLHRQAQAIEQDLLDLLGRAEVEGLARRRIRVLLLLQDLFSELVALRLELLLVEQHAVALHAEEHGEHRHLDFAIHKRELFVRLDSRVEQVVQRQHAIGLLCGVLRGAADLHRGEGNASDALAGHLLVAERGPAAMALREAAQIVALVHFEHIRLEQRVVNATREPNAVVLKHVRVELHVLADFLAVGALQPGLQQLQRAFETDLWRRTGIVVPQRQVHGLVAEGESESYQSRGHRLLADAHRVEAHHVERFDLENEILQLVFVENGSLTALLEPTRWFHLRQGQRRRGGVLDFLQPALELEAPVELALFGEVGLAVGEGLQV